MRSPKRQRREEAEGAGEATSLTQLHCEFSETEMASTLTFARFSAWHRLARVPGLFSS